MIDRVLAQTPPQIVPPINPSDLGGQSWSTLREVVQFALSSFILPILTALAILYLVWAGYQFITSAGDPAQAEKARRNILYAIIGVVLMLISYGLVRFLGILAGQAQP
jgi:hypothetical protein